MSSKTVPLVTLDQVRQDVDRVLVQFYSARLAAAQQISPQYHRLWSVLYDAYKAGGKRLRPYVMLLAYQAVGGDKYEGALRVAAGLELLHTALLVHDDIIDKDIRRHGELNPIGRYRQLYTAEQSGHVAHFANSAALIAGDLAIAGAYQLILESNLAPQERVRCSQLLSDVLFTVGGGQLLDMEAVWQPLGNVDPLQIARLKTASYSFVGPLTLGARLGGADDTTLAGLQQYGEAIGIAFQLTDDILGVFGEEATTGKSATSDLTEGKQTYLIQQAWKRSDTKSQEALSTVLDGSLHNATSVTRAREIIIASGALMETECLINTYAAQASTALVNLTLRPEAYNALEALIEQVTRRTH